MSSVSSSARRRRRAIGALAVPLVALLPGCSKSDQAGGGDVATVVSSSSSPAATTASTTATSASASASGSGSGSGSRAGASALVATADGLGPAKIGQPVVAFGAAIGHPVKPTPAGEPTEECWVRSLSGLPQVRVMVLKKVTGPVSRVDVIARGIRTDNGIGVGSTRAQVLAAYPDARSETGKYDPAAQDITVTSGAHALLFTVDAKGIVSQYRFGESDPVSWAESCG